MKHQNIFNVQSLILLGLLIILTWSCKKEDLPTLATLPVLEITGNTAKSGGNITDDGGASVTSRGVFWGTSDNPTMNNKEGSTTDGIGDGQFTSNITGLSPGTTYFIRAYAVNNAGTAYGNQDQFTTVDLASVTTTGVTDIAHKTATSGGNVTKDGGANVISRGVVWGTSENPTIDNYVGKTTDGSGTGSFISELSELNPGRIYYVRAYATNLEGTSYGSQVEFATIGDAPGVTTKNATNITSTSVVLSGTVSPNDLSTTVIFEYGITTDYGSEVDAEQSPVSGNTSTDVSADIIDLSPGKTYHFRLKAENDVGVSYGDDMTFTTLAVLPTVTTAEVSEVTATSAISGGNVTDDGGAEVTSRGVVWSTIENPTIDDNEGYTEDGDGTGGYTSEIKDLLPETNYYIRSYVTNNVGTFYGQQESLETQTDLSGIYGQPCPNMPTFIDERDGIVYNTVQIGNQCWLKGNLKYLPEVYSPRSESQTEPHYYVYGYEGTDISEAVATGNYKNYGVLYNWPAAMNGEGSNSDNPSVVQGVCPAGWYLPSHDEWTELEQFVCQVLGNSDCNTKFPYDNTTIEWLGHNEANALKSCRQDDSPLGEECATTEHPRWNWHNTNYGTDQVGFSALPSGLRLNNGNFSGNGHHTIWWSSTESSSTLVWDRRMENSSGSVNRSNLNKELGVSVRCVRDIN